VISTIGFPLVGGPAGTMEGGRQAEVAQEILRRKNVPYFVAAPMLVQDLRSWCENGIAGLQSVVRLSRPLAWCTRVGRHVKNVRNEIQTLLPSHRVLFYDYA
jgi:hypothetical protein